MAGRLFVLRGKTGRLACDGRADDARALEKMARKLERERPRHGRVVPVVCAEAPRDPEVIAARVEELAQAAGQMEIDVALTTCDARTFLAAQQARENIDGAFADLSRDQIARSRALGQMAAEGSLVVFLGAGVSAAAGMPLWNELLHELAVEAKMSAAEIEDMRELHPLDRARLLERRFGDRKTLAERLKARFRGEHAALGHILLAGLPIKEAVTTNYDELFELASRDLDLGVSVLPDAPDKKCDRWLFKIHGSIAGDSDDDLVVTREDMMRFPDRRAALAGIVQALLITRHMLFVGFSLEDENFHRIADAVRRAVLPTGGEAFGTAVVLTPRPLVEELWDGDLEFVNAAPAGTPAPAAARQLEIFLDRLSADACLLHSASHMPNGRVGRP